MAKIIVQGHIDVPEDDLEQVIAALPRHIELTCQEPGCLTFQVERDNSHPCRFRVYEVFADETAFAAHQQRVLQSEWGRIARNVHRSYTVSTSD